MICGPQRAVAAEWSITPTFSTTMDYDSNRFLVTNGRDSGSGTISADLRFARAMEDSVLTVEPAYTLRRFTDGRLGNGDDRSIGTGWLYKGERSTLQANASYFDQSTLTTELLETGITSVNTHRRQSQAALNWNWAQTELRHLVTQMSYLDTHYYGPGEGLLPGYRYASGSIGEQFNLSEKASLTTSVFGDELSSHGAPPSHEYGVQADLIYAFNERTRFDGTVGESSRLLNGDRSHGTNASLSLVHDSALNNVTLSYVRSLTPYGIGYLVERQQTSLTDIYHLSPFVDASIIVMRIDNSKNAVLLGLDRPKITSIATAVTWRPTETVSLGLQLSVIQAPAVELQGARIVETQTLRDWHAGLRASWAPLPTSVSR
jgi:hypothetical protein